MNPASVRGPLLLATLCALPLVLWARSAPLSDRFTGPFTSLTSLAVLFALAGTSAFALNLVLAARLRVVERLFGGLDRVYRVHRRTGEIAFILLLTHVALILSSRATISLESAFRLLGPGAGWTVFAGVLAFSGLSVLILMTLFVRLGHEVFVYVQRGFGFVFLVASYHVFRTSGAKADSAALEVYLATLAAIAVAAFVYRSVLGNVLVRRHPYRIRAVNRLDDFVTEIAMDPLARPLAFTPGQFVYVNFRSLALTAAFRPVEVSAQGQVFSIRAGEISNQFHPFSITSAPGDPTLRITVKAVGDYTRAMRALEADSEAVVEGPYGSFSYRNVPNAKQIWIAGGIGVTPFLSMARSLNADGGPAVDFFYGVERREEAHFLEEFHAIAARRPDFRVHLVPRDEVGFLTAERIAAASGRIEYQDVLMCGPPPMIANLRSQLTAKGVRPDRIHAEEFGFAKLGTSAVTGLAGRPSAAPAVGAIGVPGPRPRSKGFPEALAMLAALGFAGLMFAVGIVVGRNTGSSGAGGPSATAAPDQGAADAAAGRAVFADAGCGDCHTLRAAGASADVGPDLDELRPDAGLVRDVVANGKGAMPAFGELSDQELRDLAAFVAEAAGGG